MIYGTDLPRFFRLAHGADPLLASILCASRCGHGLPFAKAVTGGRNLCRIFYCITVLAMDGLTSCFGAGRWLINRKIRIPAVPRGRNRFLITVRIIIFTDVGLCSIFRTRCRFRHSSFIPVMIYGTDLTVFFRLAHGADPPLASIFRAGRGGHGLPFAKAVAGGRNLRRIFYRITVPAVDGFTSCFCTGRWLINRKIRIPAVARSCFFLISTVCTVFTSVIFFPAFLRTGCLLCIMMYKVVTISRNWLRVSVIAVIFADIGAHAIIRAGGFGSHVAFVVVIQRRNLHGVKITAVIPA